MLVVVLLHDGSQGAGNAHAVAAHEEGNLVALLVHERGAHGAGVLVAQLEDLGHLDAAGPIEGQPALGAAITGLDRRQVGPLVHREVLTEAGAHIVEAVLVGADHPLGHRLQARARDNTRALGQPHRAHGALAQAEVLHLLIGQQRKSGHHALDL